MAVDSGINAQGTTFEISADGVTYTALGCVKTWDWTKPARAEIDTTCLTDTEKSFRFGLKDNGTLAVETLYDRGAGSVLAEASYDSDVAYYFKVTYADTPATVKTFQGFVISISENGGLDDVIGAALEIRVSGAITEA